MDFDIEYRPGRVHQAPDALSQLETTNPNITPLDDDIPVMDICFLDTPTLGTIAAIQAAQTSDDGSDDNDEPGHTRHNIDQPFNESPVHQRFDLVRSREEASAEPITTDVFIAEQTDDPDCAYFRVLFTRQGSQFFTDETGFFCRKSPSSGYVQKVVPPSLHPWTLYLSHNTPLKGHPCVSKMYENITDELYWPSLFGDVENYVANCLSCFVTFRTLRKNQTVLKLFPPNGSLEDLEVELLGPLPLTRDKESNVLVITERYSKYAQMVTLGAVNTHVIASTVLHA